MSVGTDHHPFDRLIEWLDRWLAERARDDLRCLVQHGSSRPPKAGGREYMDHDELQTAMTASTVVVCHGGPATITEARRTGHIPIVVPRDPARGEHIDDHQLRFADRIDAGRLAVCCTSERTFRNTLDAAVADTRQFQLARPDEVARGDAPVPEPVRHAGALIDELLGSGEHAENRKQGKHAERGKDGHLATTPAPDLTPATFGGEWPAVAVVIPTKDRPELVRETVDSVLAQDYPGTIHCLVVFDGGSPDRTLVDRAPGGGDDHRRVSVTTNTRTPGLAGGRNSGILAAAANGADAAAPELVAFCDDDDTWLPGKLRAQVDALRAVPEASLVCCGIRVDYADTSVDRYLSAQRVDRRDLLRSRLTELHPSTFVIRRPAVLDGFGLVNEDLPGSYAEDYELLLRAAAYGPIVNVPDVHVRVRWHAESHFASRWDTVARALTVLLDNHRDFHEVPKGYARVAGQIAFAQAALGHRREALRWMRRTLRARPAEPRAYLATAVALRAVTPETVLRALHRTGRGL